MSQSSTSVMQMTQSIGGIDRAFIENIEEYDIIFQEMRCPICLRIVLNPKECSACQIMVCNDCAYILTTAGRKCVREGCKGELEKSNKFIRDILDNLKIKCYACKQKGFGYKQYLEHIKTCESYLTSPVQKCLIQIHQQEEKIAELNNKFQNLLEKYSPKLSDDEVRKKYLTNKRTVSEKMSLYKASVKQGVEDFKRLIEVEGYPMFEEVSAQGCYWTPLHYAMHYGKWDVIKYILDYCLNNGSFREIMQLKSNDKRCPILCLLRSSALKIEQKREIFKLILQNYRIKITDEIRKDLENRKVSYLLEGYKSL